VIELDAQVLAGGGEERTVQVRWRAREAMKVSLYQDGQLVNPIATLCLRIPTNAALPARPSIGW
jgi:hypothetical protein